MFFITEKQQKTIPSFSLDSLIVRPVILLGHPPASQKYFLISCVNIDYCQQTKEKNKTTKKHSAVINNFYFLVLDYLES